MNGAPQSSGELESLGSQDLLEKLWIHYAALLALAVGFSVWLYLGFEIGVGSLSRPSGGLWPTMVSSSGLALSVASIILMRRSHEDLSSARTLFSDVMWKKVVVVSLGSAGFLILYPLIGFVYSAGLAMALLLRFVSGVKWIPTLVTSVVATLIVYLLFREVLGVRF